MDYIPVPEYAETRLQRRLREFEPYSMAVSIAALGAIAVGFVGLDEGCIPEEFYLSSVASFSVIQSMGIASRKLQDRHESWRMDNDIDKIETHNALVRRRRLR